MSVLVPRAQSILVSESVSGAPGRSPRPCQGAAEAQPGCRRAGRRLAPRQGLPTQRSLQHDGLGMGTSSWRGREQEREACRDGEPRDVPDETSTGASTWRRPSPRLGPQQGALAISTCWLRETPPLSVPRAFRGAAFLVGPLCWGRDDTTAQTRHRQTRKLPSCRSHGQAGSKTRGSHTSLPGPSGLQQGAEGRGSACRPCPGPLGQSPAPRPLWSTEDRSGSNSFL